MGISKRRKAIKEAEAEANRKWEEHIRLNPPPPPPPWTADELKKFDRMSQILDDLTYGQSQDIDLVFELLGYEYLLQYSLRMMAIRRMAAHYRELAQYAAKANLWAKIYDNLSGLNTEVSLARSSRERGGAGVQ
jgi:hypothetical protein